MTEVKRQYELGLCDGEVVPVHRLVVPVGSLAMRYALSVFEGIRVYKSSSGSCVYFALDAHLERLVSSLVATGLPTIDPERLRDDLIRLLECNGVNDDAYLRVAASATGSGDLYATPRISVSATLTPMGRKSWLKDAKGMRVQVSARRKPSDAMFPQYAKNISNYPGPRLALLEAREQGFDSVVLLSADGYLAEAPTANLFLVRGGVLLTPRLEDGILPGITRHVLLSLASQLGIEARSCALRPDELRSADEAFLCGTGLEIAPIGQVDQVAFSETRPITQRLMAAYFDLVRRPEATRKVGLDTVGLAPQRDLS
jgi:branched-chain amino acid aminotransferase